MHCNILQKIMKKFLTLLLYTALVWCCFNNTPAYCLANETDRLALISFKGSIDQDPLGALSSWNDSLHYCDWKGVTCSRRHQDRVIELNLWSQGLVGSLTPHIGNLSFLRRIVIKNNSFHGPIPQEIGRLFRLRTLEFSNNSFGGRIPKNLSSCSNLKYVNLIDNHLTGNIPGELGSLAKLEAIGLGQNNFSGTIPLSFTNLSSLSILSLQECNLHGEIPVEISRLQGLTFVDLLGNNLSGKIPSGLFNISTINTLTVGFNKLHGSISSDTGSSTFALPNLQYLSLSTNQFTGMIPASLSNASGLGIITFYGNSFTGPMPKDLGKLYRLQYISFGANRLQDDFSFISSLTNCTSLQFIQLERNLLRGSLPDSIANLSTKMRWLSMGDNQVQGSIPSGIGNLINLTAIYMGYNQLSGPIPETIGKLLKLQELQFEGNSLTELPSSFGNLTLLNRLHLDQNNIYGRIPLSIGNLHNLLELNIAYNNLTGSIPHELMSLSSISISLNLAHNGLTGALPSEVGSLKNVGELDLSNNELSGPIPNSLQNCLSLERLMLGGNSFEGEIPTILSELRGLRELDLSQNNLSGSIPSYLGNLQLEKLNLSFNHLHGEVPMEGVFRNRSSISVVGNSDLCGGIPDLKLPSCRSSKHAKFNLSNKVKVILTVVIVIFFCLSSLACFFILSRWRRASRDKASHMPSFKHQLLKVSYAELLKATDGFSEDNLVGVGNYGSVYRGILTQSQKIVAVKVLNLHTKGASKSFMSECKALRSIRHRNLLKVVSACSSIDYNGNEFKALVCEFMANGSLEKWLHHDGVENDGEVQESRSLTMIQRLNIAIDVASALEYLHCHCDSRIIHGDLKPSNVLLDDEMTAHVGDFGLAKIIASVSSQLEQDHSNSTAVTGTIGYVAPEYGLGDRASTEGDMYSYGILLLEMFTGTRPTDNVFKDTLSLHNFVESALPNQVMEIVDPCIRSEHDPRSWFKDTLVSVLRIGVACSMESPRDRMQIQAVVNEIRKIKDVYGNHALSQSHHIENIVKHEGEGIEG